MPLSWNEIRHNAIRFAKEARHYTSESADKQTFWNDFFGVFGLPRKTVASFEVPVLKTSGSFGKIDLLWKGVLLVEHKSAGEDLGKAKTQAFDYIQAMAAEGRRKELPRYVIVSDFANVVLHDLEEDTRVTFPLAQLHQHIHDFAFIPGYKQHKFEEQDPINIEATEMLGELHDALEFGGYAGHHLEQFLVRVLFCLFAEDTGLFQREAFRLYLENRTAEDGSDLGPRLAQLFGVLNTPVEQRQKNLDEELQQFPYVNGDLFSEQLGFAEFNRDMRNALLACTRFDWSRISPAIFGSLFQAVMEPKERRQIGGHYTSERDILKVIRSLFLDDLRAEFEKITGRKLSAEPRPVPGRSGTDGTDKGADKPLPACADDALRAGTARGPLMGMRRRQLEQFHDRISRLNYLDPACGCGNFLVITYRELRALETEVLLALYQSGDQELDVRNLARVDVHQFYGIEISEWPARIAEVALWLMDHQMNMRLSDAFGGWYPRLPLKKSPHIHCGNALRTDWQEVLPPAQCSYVLGNPPFIGSKFQNDEQRADMDAVAGEIENTGLLDYVTGWYFKAAEYIKGSRIVVGFVSTNSISQGEQVGVLWNPLFQQFGITIHFAHRTFAWQSEARGKAHVHVVIIGFANFETAKKQIYEYEGEKVSATTAKNISPYLIEGSNIAVTNRSQPICDVPEMGIGNKPIDDGNYLFTPEEKAEFLRVEPAAKKYFRRWFGSIEFINNIERWGLWLGECPPSELRAMPHAMARVEAVQKFRLASKSAPTRKIAATPTRYHVENFPKRAFLIVPEVSSERRHYIPIGFMQPDVLCSNLVKIVPDATPFHFGVLSSAMHMAWVRQVCGRMKSDYRYSNKLVYNNYPWPETVSEKQRAAVEAAAQKVLAVRAEFLAQVGRASSRAAGEKARRESRPTTETKTATLADLYDPLATPPALQKAHEELDRAVDKCYRPEPFTSERQRVEFLFARYEKLTAPLITATKPKRKRTNLT